MAEEKKESKIKGWRKLILGLATIGAGLLVGLKGGDWKAAAGLISIGVGIAAGGNVAEHAIETVGDYLKKKTETPSEKGDK